MSETRRSQRKRRSTVVNSYDSDEFEDQIRPKRDDIQNNHVTGKKQKQTKNAKKLNNGHSAIKFEPPSDEDNEFDQLSTSVHVLVKRSLACHSFLRSRLDVLNCR